MQLRIKPASDGVVLQFSVTVEKGRNVRQTVGNMSRCLEDSCNFFRQAIADMDERLADGTAADLLEGYTYNQM